MKQKRRKARILALQALFQAEVAKNSPEEAINNVLKYIVDNSIISYVDETVKGVWEKLSWLDERISHFSENWRIERLALVDRTILRIALFEIEFQDDVPPIVAVNEAIELAKKFGDTDSGRFINGILGAYLKEKGIEKEIG